MKILLNHQIERSQWKTICEESPFSSPFQTPEFFDFFNAVKGFSADVFAVEVNLKLTCLVVVTQQKEPGIKSWFSRRGIVYGGPLLSGDEVGLIYLLKEMAGHYRRKLIYLEIRNYFDFSEYTQSMQHGGFSLIPWLNFQLQITDVDTMKKTMSSSRLRHIKKAIKSGSVWKVADKLDDVVAFYAILNDLYKNKIKKPLFTLDFFTTFFERKIGVFLLVYYENKVIGGIMCPVLKEKSIYEFYVCGLDTEFKDQYPSVMATWAAMEYAAQNNIKVFDFMGAGNPKEDYGVREFKSRFGGNELNHGRYLSVINPVLYQIGKWGLFILSRLKQ